MNPRKQNFFSGALVVPQHPTTGKHYHHSIQSTTLGALQQLCNTMPPTKRPKIRHAPETTRESSAASSHPSRGGCRGYDIATRQMAMSIKLNGEEDNPLVDALRAQGLHPSKRTTNRWAQRQATIGHLHPFEMNGNNPATVLKGNKLFMLALY